MALALISSPGAAAVGVVAGGGNKGNSRFLMRHLGLPPLLHPLVFLLATSLLSPWHLQTVTTSANTLSDSYFNHRADPFALLSGTLRMYQKIGCDLEYMTLRCPTGTSISVQSATFGKNPVLPGLCQQQSSSIGSSKGHQGFSNNVTSSSSSSSSTTCQLPPEIQVVVGVCQKKTSCKFQTLPSGGGGGSHEGINVPCPGIRKSVEVGYKCKPSEFKSVIGCKGEVIQLKCNRSMRIAIYSANFGRTEYESVQCPQRAGVHEESCLSTFATEIVMQICHGKRGCALEVNPKTFGSPCKAESSMYLKAIYACVPKKVLSDAYGSEPERDELFEEAETEYETGDPTEGVKEQPSIYSPDHSKGGLPGWVHPKSTSKPSNSPSNMKSSTSYSSSGNSSTLWLYITIIVSSSLILILLGLLFMKKRVTNPENTRRDSSGASNPIDGNTAITITNNSSNPPGGEGGGGMALTSCTISGGTPGGESDHHLKSSSSGASTLLQLQDSASALLMSNMAGTGNTSSSCLSSVGVVEDFSSLNHHNVIMGDGNSSRVDCCFSLQQNRDRGNTNNSNNTSGLGLGGGGGGVGGLSNSSSTLIPGWTTTSNDPPGSGVSVSALITPVSMNFNSYHGLNRTRETTPSARFY